ncbi:MAG: hypothetical protein JWN50_199 [Parcubacteria group bacterium]|nr:hypothetical protein [Parcubacteria group bacterium]
MSNTIKLAVNRGFGSLENEVQESSGEWIEVEEMSQGVFTIIGDGMTGEYLTLGIWLWDDEVEDLDAGNSDESQCFGMSDHLKWGDVEFDLCLMMEIRASSLDQLKEALKHVVFCAWDPEDI